MTKPRKTDADLTIFFFSFTGMQNQARMIQFTICKFNPHGISIFRLRLGAIWTQSRAFSRVPFDEESFSFDATLTHTRTVSHYETQMQLNK